MSILRNSVNIFITQAFVLVATMATYVLAARTLGTSGFGIYSLVIVFHTFLLWTLNFGFSPSNTFSIAKRKHSFAELHTASLIASSGIGLLLILLYYLGGGAITRFILKGISPSLAWMAVLALPFSLYYSYVQGIWIGLERISLINKLDLFRAIAWVSATLVAFIIFGADVAALLLAWLASWVVSAALVFYMVRRGERVSLRFNVNSFKELTNFGFRVHLASLGFILHLRFDAFVVNYFLGLAEISGFPKLHVK